MRLVCNVLLENRALPSSVKSHSKHVKSTLAICRHPKNEKDYMIILFNTQHKTGIKYKLNNNVQNVLGRFINEGKVTIQLKEPSVNLCVQSDPIQLKSFMLLVKKALDNTITSRDMMSSASVTAVTKNVAPKKLVVKNRSDFPKHGFPRTLEQLYINEIDLCKLNIGVLQLQKLRLLDVSHNNLECLPTDLNNLPLETLNVSHNKLCKSTLKQWEWIGGQLTKTLKSLNLSDNNLLCLPNFFVKLTDLTYVNLNNNNLTVLPSGFGNFRKLRVVSLANNKLTAVPGSMNRLHLEELDLSNNNFRAYSVAAKFFKTLPVCSLKESAARKVLHAKLPYNYETLPRELVHYLDYSAHYCICGRPCFEVHLWHTDVLKVKSITQTVIFNRSHLHYVPMDCRICSLRCLRKNARPTLPE